MRISFELFHTSMERLFIENEITVQQDYDTMDTKVRVWFGTDGIELKFSDHELDEMQSVDELLAVARNKLREELLNPRYWRVNADDLIRIVQKFQNETGKDQDYTVKGKFRAKRDTGPMFEDSWSERFKPSPVFKHDWTKYDDFERTEPIDRHDHPDDRVGKYRG